MNTAISSPFERFDWVGHDALEEKALSLISDGALSQGWVLAGRPGIGKATFAYRLARALLSPEAMVPGSLGIADPSAQAVRLLVQRAHPDLFVAERRFDEKKDRVETEISVDTIRELITFMTRTPALSAWRVAIVDTADDLNRNAANALLKILEEPPAKTALFLLSAQPGRLLPTIRSRCRVLSLRPVADAAVQGFLEREGVSDPSAGAARAAEGRPGRALTLAMGPGGDAVTQANAFLSRARIGDTVEKTVAALSGDDAETKWPIFVETVMAALSKAARSASDQTPLAMSPIQALAAYDAIGPLFDRADAINLDRKQTLFAAARALRRCASDLK
ncbi:MAG: DNA polymerase III subunit delta' [Pseudomonadota bacterium]